MVLTLRVQSIAELKMGLTLQLGKLLSIGNTITKTSRRTLLKCSTCPVEQLCSTDPVLGQVLGCFRPLDSLSEAELKDRYERIKRRLKNKRLPTNIEASGVFANDELNLSKVDVYGFNYDYTLATYNESVAHFIYEETKNILVDELKYPEHIRNFKYKPTSVIRGLHYDIKKGILMKLDSFARIELGTVYRGHQRLSDEEVFNLYKKRYLPAYYIDSSNSQMVQLADAFSKPQMCILSDVLHWFDSVGIDCQPESLYADVNTALSRAHPRFHTVAATNSSKLLDNSESQELIKLLTRIRNHNKQVFVITNSPYKIVHKGMSFMLGNNWQDYFDVVIVDAKKPSFFARNNSAVFREYSTKHDRLKWRRVLDFEPNKVYAGGNIEEFTRMTGWCGEKVLYLGDHVYAGLADLSLDHGWRTGAIIQDIEEEVDRMNNEDFKWTLNWSTVLRHTLIENFQDAARSGQPEIATLLDQWSEEYFQCKTELKTHLNPKFGSVFRCSRNPSYLSKRLFAYSDIYTSKVTNLNGYSLNHTFYPSRGVLPHEFKSWFL